ncbi:MAG: DUF1772 domain-containing protein [Chloroflexota bacterium]
MNTNVKTTAFTLCFVLVTAISFVYLFMAIGLVPYWQTLSGTEIQTWFQEPFGRFGTLMGPVHILSIIATITAYVMHRKETGVLRWLWLVALITLLICQFFNFVIYGANFNPSLQSGTLEPDAALALFDWWDFWHIVRTISVCISMVCLGIISIISRMPDSESSVERGI